MSAAAAVAVAVQPTSAAARPVAAAVARAGITE
jgi:hypothetical protein